MYSKCGVNDFVICCGYKGYLIKEYFANYFLHQSDVTFYMRENRMEVHDGRAEPWKVTLVDTGESAQTGGRLLAVSKYIDAEEMFCLTYGDGVSDIDIAGSIEFHKKHGKLATVASVLPPGRFGALELEGSSVKSFMEKPKGDGGMINGGFFVLSSEVLNRIENSQSVWEQEPLKSLAVDGELMAFEHQGFWQPMDTLRDKILLEDLWVKNKAPWKTW
jgi:glucose-1-phosphate cytidylyltransferase